MEYWHVGVMLVIALLVGAGIGMAFGEPRFINMEEIQKNNLIASKDRECGKLLKENTRTWEAYVEQLDSLWENKYEDVLYARNYCQSRLTDFAENYRDLNDSITWFYRDLNQSIFDLNLGC